VLFEVHGGAPEGEGAILCHWDKPNYRRNPEKVEKSDRKAAKVAKEIHSGSLMKPSEPRYFIARPRKWLKTDRVWQGLALSIPHIILKTRLEIASSLTVLR
jgi:hypothetical protein